MKKKNKRKKIIERPKPKFKTSPRLRELANEISEVNEKLREIINKYNEHKNRPKSSDFKKALKAFKEKPSLEKQFDNLIKSHNKECFEVAYGESLDFVRRKAFTYGDKNAWLMLLRWDIQYLESKYLRAAIYKAHRDKEFPFLEEIAHILTTHLKPHGHVNKKLYNYIHSCLDQNESKKDIIQKVYDKFKVHIDYKQLRRMGFS
jgi:hypothetical protein